MSWESETIFKHVLHNVILALTGKVNISDSHLQHLALIFFMVYPLRVCVFPYVSNRQDILLLRGGCRQLYVYYKKTSRRLDLRIINRDNQLRLFLAVRIRRGYNPLFLCLLRLLVGKLFQITLSLRTIGTTEV